MGNDLTSPNGHNPKTAAAAHGQVTSMGTAQKQWQYCLTVECTARRSRNCMAVSCQAFLFVSCGVVILHLFPRAHHGAKPFLAFFSNARRSVEETKEGCSSSFLSLHFLMQMMLRPTLRVLWQTTSHCLTATCVDNNLPGTTEAEVSAAQVLHVCCALITLSYLLWLTGSVTAMGDAFNATLPPVKLN